MMIMVIVLAIFILIFVFSGIKVVKEWERVVILRLGKYYGIRGPGIIWKMPILDSIPLRISLREQSTDIDTGKYVSLDGSSRRLKGIVLWRVIDIEKYVLRIEDHQRTVNKTIQHQVSKIAESMTSDAVFSDTDELSQRIEESLEPTLSGWGLKITKVDLRTAPDWE